MNTESDRTEFLGLSRHPRWSRESFPLGNACFRCVSNILSHIFNIFQIFRAGIESLTFVVSQKEVPGGIDENQGFWWILEISWKIWNLIVRSWRVYPSGVARGGFYPRKRTFQRRLKKFENKISCFSTLSGRFGVVEFSRCGHIQQNDQNWWKSMILMDFGDFMIFMKSHSATTTGIPIGSCAGRVLPSKTRVSEAFEKVWK